ncbi:MAG: HAMP domain-containing histidine kinase [Actinobacteria bacterium]|nr:MAG: HAMP domain-containing histidine kinase [Actinomycetota bacterium]
MAAGRTPQLTTRLALGSLLLFVSIGAVLAFLVSGQLRGRQEQAATYHAEFVAGSILRYELTPQDVAQPVDPRSARYQYLQEIVRKRLLAPPVVRLKLWRDDGTIVLSDEPRLIGRNFGVDDELKEAFLGEPSSGVTDLSDAENVFERTQFKKLFSTYVPVYLVGARDHGEADAVAELYTDYAGIQSQVSHLFQTLVATLIVGLGALYLLLLPIIRRVTRTLAVQNVKLEEQAGRLQTLLETEQQTVAELRELNRLKDDFVAMASHEVRTPLTSIIGYAKTLRRPEFANDGAAREEFLQAIERQGDRLSRLVGNLLAASHIEDDRAHLTLAPFSLPELVEDVLAGLGPRAKRVAVTLPTDLPPLVTDRQRMELILANLLDNALKFSPNGHRCDLQAWADEQAVVVSVRDRGIGIAPQDLGKIFDRFYQVDSSVTRRYGGVGLGLNIVQELVESIGGTIDVSSSPGEGSTFTVRIPFAPPWSAAEAERSPRAEPAAAR